MMIPHATLKPLLALSCAFLVPFVATAVERTERGALVLEDVPTLSSELAARLEPYLDIRRTTFLDWTADGAMLVTARAGATEQVHRVEEPLGALQQLTSHEEPIARARYSPQGAYKGFFFLRDTGGNENTQIFFQSYSANEPNPAKARRLTDGSSINGAPLWTHNGRQIAFFSTARNGVSEDIYFIDPDSAGPPRLALAVEGKGWRPLDFSTDDTRMLVKHEISDSESYLYVVDVATGNKTRILPIEEDKRIGFGDARFSRDGRGIYFICDDGSEYRQLRYLPFATDENKQPTENRLSAQVPWDVELFDLSNDGRYLVYATNEGGLSRLRLRDIRNGFDMPSPTVPSGKILNLGFDPSGARLAISLETARAPREVYVYQVGSSTLTQWTHSDLAPLNTTEFIDAQLIYYSTFDRSGRGLREIPAFIFKPRRSEPAPVLIALQGGPGTQYRPGFEAFTQFLVKEMGVAVIAPNVRNSSGYGKSYRQLDDDARRENAITDIGALIVWIGQQPDLDRSRIIVMGSGSQGGYLSLSTLVYFGDRLLGGIDMSGAHTLINSQRITKPVLIAQGRNDPHVVATETERMVAALRGRGREAGYLLATDEGHVWRKQPNRAGFWQAAAGFIEQLTKQKKEEEPAAPTQ